MVDEIEVLGVRARRVGYDGEQYEARTPLGARSPADAAREATRRLRAIMRTCARAGAV